MKAHTLMLTLVLCEWCSWKQSSNGKQGSSWANLIDIRKNRMYARGRWAYASGRGGGGGGGGGIIRGVRRTGKDLFRSTQLTLIDIGKASKSMCRSSSSTPPCQATSREGASAPAVSHYVVGPM